MTLIGNIPKLTFTLSCTWTILSYQALYYIARIPLQAKRSKKTSKAMNRLPLKQLNSLTVSLELI